MKQISEDGRTDKNRVRIANSFLRLLEEKEVSKISVTDIMSPCGISRQMFYKYFVDIDDLIYWIHMQEAFLFIDLFFEGETFIQTFTRLMHYMRENAAFYRSISRKDGPNSFGNQFYEQMKEQTFKNIRRKKLTAELEFAVTLYWKGAALKLIDWVESGMKTDPEVMAEYFYASLPVVIQPFYER